MKIIISLLTLFITTSAYANTLIKRNDCESRVKDFNSCFDTKINSYNDINDKILDKICSKKCKKIIDDYDKYFSGCSNVVTTIEKSEEPRFKASVKFICSTDGGGNQCPMPKLTVKKSGTIDITTFNQTIIDTCKSKRCTESLKTAYDYIFPNKETRNLKNYLETKECLSKNDARSATKLNASLFLLSLSLFLLFFI